MMSFAGTPILLLLASCHTAPQEKAPDDLIALNCKGRITSSLSLVTGFNIEPDVKTKRDSLTLVVDLRNKQMLRVRGDDLKPYACSEGACSWEATPERILMVHEDQTGGHRVERTELDRRTGSLHQTWNVLGEGDPMFKVDDDHLYSCSRTSLPAAAAKLREAPRF